MKTKYYVFFAIIGIALTSSGLILTEPYTYNTLMALVDAPTPYIPSDISKSNPYIQVGVGASSIATININEVKDQVIYTIKGKVMEIGEPVPWTDNAGNQKGAIPVKILVDRAYKGKINSGEILTVYLDSIKVEDQYYLGIDEASFEVGEEVIIHAALSNTGPDISDVYYVKLGMFGKYNIIDGKAYNERFPYGITLDSAGRQAK